MQELESGAVATLREISDYPFLFDQKIGELQRLYQSLEVKEAIQQTKKT